MSYLTKQALWAAGLSTCLAVAALGALAAVGTPEDEATGVTAASTPGLNGLGKLVLMMLIAASAKD